MESHYKLRCLLHIDTDIKELNTILKQIMYPLTGHSKYFNEINIFILKMNTIVSLVYRN